MTIDFGLISLGPSLTLDLAIHEQMIRLLPFSDVGFENPTVKIQQVQKVALGIPTGLGALDSFESLTYSQLILPSTCLSRRQVDG